MKCIYELIASNAIPTDAYIAETVMMNTDTLQDEIEDLRYGPFIAADLRNFINQNELSNQVTNLREHVFGKIITLPANEFLALMKGILLQTPQARTYIDNLCQEIAAEIRQRDIDIRFGEGDFSTDENIKASDDDVLDNVDNTKEAETDEIVDVVDYSKKSKQELTNLMDEALDKGDFETVSKIRPFLK